MGVDAVSGWVTHSGSISVPESHDDKLARLEKEQRRIADEIAGLRKTKPKLDWHPQCDPAIQVIDVLGVASGEAAIEATGYKAGGTFNGRKIQRITCYPIMPDGFRVTIDASDPPKPKTRGEELADDLVRDTSPLSRLEGTVKLFNFAGLGVGATACTASEAAGWVRMKMSGLIDAEIAKAKAEQKAADVKYLKAVAARGDYTNWWADQLAAHSD